ncbi:hypothetical protein [Hydrogenimonas sp.]
MKRTMVATAIFMGVACSLFAADGKTLFTQKCAICHLDHRPTPEERNKMVAPPAMGVMFHVKEKYPDKARATAFMVDYVLHPDKKKALCPSVRRFGLMPSQEGIVTKRELEAIVSYMFDTFPPKGFSHPRGMGMGRGMGGNGPGRR